MKKLFFIFVLLFCLAAGYAEKGYNGFAWFTNQNKIDFRDVAKEWEINEQLKGLHFSEIILGDRVIKIYYFENEKFVGASYYIPRKSLKELLSKFDKKNKVLEIKTDTIEVSAIARAEARRKIKEGNYPTVIKNIESKEKQVYIYSIFIAEKNTLEFARKYEVEGYKNIEKSKDSSAPTVYIYEANDDTRLYIINKKTEDYIYVAYVPHEQDY